MSKDKTIDDLRIVRDAVVRGLNAALVELNTLIGPGIGDKDYLKYLRARRDRITKQITIVKQMTAIRILELPEVQAIAKDLEGIAEVVDGEAKKLPNATEILDTIAVVLTFATKFTDEIAKVMK